MHLFKLILPTSILMLVANGCAPPSQSHVETSAEMRADFERLTHEGKVNDGVPKPGTDLATVPAPTTAMGKANRAEIDRVQSVILSSASHADNLSADARQAVAAPMRDPGSAQFRNIKVMHYQGHPYICGQVNGKNGFGGYVGFTDFLFVAPSIIVLNGDKSSPYYISLMEANYPLADQQIIQDAAIQYFCG